MAYPFEPDRSAAAEAGDGAAAPPVRRLPIVSADERLAEPRTIKGVLLGTTGIGKTWQLKTLVEQATLFWDLEAGDLTVQDWRGDAIRPRKWEECRDLAVFIGGPNPALRPDQPYSSAHYEEVYATYMGAVAARPAAQPAPATAPDPARGPGVRPAWAQ